MSFLDNLSFRAMGIRAPLKSKRAPAGALGLTGWQSENEPIYETYSAEQAIHRAYESNVYVYRCIEAISNSIVSCPFRAGDAVSFNFRLTHPLAKLLGPAPGSPNPMMTSAMLWRFSIASYLLLGKFAWAIERDSRGVIVGLWPLRAQHIHPVPATSGSGYFKEFRYNNEGEPGYRVYKPKDIVYIWKPSLRDIREPEAAVNVAALNINVAKMLDTFDFNFLKNGAVLPNLVVTPAWASDDDRTRFQQQFISDFSGVDNAGKPIFAERTIDGDGDTEGRESIDVKPLGTNQRDAQLSNLRLAEISAICVAFGVPLSILGDASHRTFSNAFQERRNYWLETLLPKAREIADGVNVALAPLLDPTGKTVGWFDYTGVPELRPEPAIPSAQAVQFRDAGFVTEDEIRADLGLPPGKDVGLDKVWEQKKKEAEELKKKLLQNDEQGANGQENSPGSLAKEAGTEVVPPSKAPVATAPAASRQVTQTGSRVLERLFETSLSNLLTEQAATVFQRSESRRPNRDLFDADFWELRTISMLGPILGAMGHSNSSIEKFAKEINAETRHLVEQRGTNAWEGRSDAILARFKVPVDEVRRALIDIYTGNSTLEVALAGLGVSND